MTATQRAHGRLLPDDPRLPRVDAIERMRAHRDQGRLTQSQLRTVVDGICDCYSLSEIAEAASVGERDVLDLVGELGTWLSHVHGAVRRETVALSRTASDQLFPDNRGDNDAVLLPHGFEPGKRPYRRDVSRSLATIVVHGPSDSDLARFLARRYPSTTQVLTLPHLAMVRMFDELGRIDEITDVNPDNPALSGILVAAWDLLADAAERANASLSELLDLDPQQWDDDEIADGVTKVRELIDGQRWCREADVRELDRACEAADADPAFGRTALSRHIGFWRQRVAHDPGAWWFASVGEIPIGGMRRIAEKAGLRLSNPNRTEVIRVRRRLADMGLAKDIDRLVHEALRAQDAGVADEFWAVMQARADGAIDWAKRLEEVFASVGVGAGSATAD